MEPNNDIQQLLEWMPQPAFLAENGVIVYVNRAAQQQNFSLEAAVSDMLITGVDEYASFQGGSLYLTLRAEAETYCACVTKVGQQDLFCLEQNAVSPELQAMALAAQQLRAPLTNLMISTDQLLPALMASEDASMQQFAGHINQNLHRMLRLIGNMSDAARYSAETTPRYTSMNIGAVVTEVVEKVQTLAQQLEVSIDFQNLAASVSCPIDSEKLERALYNLLSNALKYSPAGGNILIRLTQYKNKLHLTVQNQNGAAQPQIRGSVFSQYLRQPAIEDLRQGIGLGMVMVRAAATAHGGTVLVDQTPENETRVTLTLSTRMCSDAPLRSPILIVDYAGEYDHAMVELSDTLPSEVYQKNSTN